MSLMRMGAALVGAAFAIVAAGMPVRAEDFRLLMLGDHYVKWGMPEFGTGATITYSFAERRYEYPDAINCGAIDPIDALLEASRVTKAQFADNVREALAMWQRVADITFRYTENAEHAQILIGAQGVPRGIAFANVWHDGGNRDKKVALITKATVCLNPLVTWKSAFDGHLNTYELGHVLAHELGHTIGLDHPGRTGQLMGYRYSEDTTRLGNGDIEGAVRLYGPAPLRTDR